MSVYTHVTDEALSFLSSHYSIGSIHSLIGIQAGIENSNYFLSSSEGEYILTVFESLSIEQVPFCMELMHYLAQHAVPCATPLAAIDGSFVVEVMGKPVSLVERLDGHSISEITEMQIEQLGMALGRWHRVTLSSGSEQGFGQQRKNRYGKKWRQQTAKELIGRLPEPDKILLEKEIALQRLYTHVDLPQGVIHSDLFRDNALFVDSQLSGIIDLYDACNGVLLYDIAVTVNAWCRSTDGRLNVDLAQMFLASYHSERKLNSLERGAWAILLREAALRFWLSRLQLEMQPKVAKLQPKKDVQEYKIILQNCILEEHLLTELWVM